MKSVTVDRGKLLGILRTNRDKHREVFEKAQIGYRDKWIEILESRLEDARLGRPLDRGVWLNEPVDQTKDYDRAIRMVEMHVDDTIELDERRFANYVLDDWDWTEQFTTTNSMYTRIT